MTTFHIPGLTAQQAEEVDKTLIAEVGKPLAPNWSTVIAILPGPPTVVVCAEQHKHSFIVPTENIIDMETFDEEKPSDTASNEKAATAP